MRLSDLWPAIAEGGGTKALEELVLDRALARLAQDRGVEVGPDHIERERLSLIAAIAGEVGSDDSLSDQALARVRVARGLGPARFAALLKRTATMRAIVQLEINLSPDEVAAQLDLMTGPKTRAVVAVFSSEQEASSVRAALAAQAEDRLQTLSSIAIARSIDPSASNQGVVGPIHARDPRVPASLRPILEDLAQGDVSPVLATDNGFAILMVESRSERLPTTPELEVQARNEVRLRKERMAMDTLARRFLSEASVHVLDESLRWSWQRTRGNASN